MAALLTRMVAPEVPGVTETEVSAAERAKGFAAVLMEVPSEKVRAPLDERRRLPATSRRSVGVVVPIPTFPVEAMTRRQPPCQIANGSDLAVPDWPRKTAGDSLEGPKNRPALLAPSALTRIRPLTSKRYSGVAVPTPT